MDNRFSFLPFIIIMLAVFANGQEDTLKGESEAEVIEHIIEEEEYSEEGESYNKERREKPLKPAQERMKQNLCSQ